MKLKQLSLFVENKPGSLNAVCQVLKNNDLNIKTLSLADTEQFGILRLLIKDWQKSQQVLENAGFIVKVTEVHALPVADHPGGLAGILDVLDRCGISVEYMYAFTFGAKDNAIMVFRFADSQAAEKVLEENHIDTIKDFNLFD